MRLIVVYADGPRRGQSITIDGDDQERTAELAQAVMVPGSAVGYELHALGGTSDGGTIVAWYIAALELNEHQARRRVLIDNPAAARDCRSKQAAYFKDRKRETLVAAKIAEKAVDRLLGT